MPAPRAPMSVLRSAASFGAATALGHASQLVWLAVGIRAMPAADFGSVLAAQALYAVLQIVVDVGTNAVGAREAARGELDDARRGQIMRMRVLLALLVAPVAIVLGALHVSGSLAATLPFVGALLLFGALNVWEPYGAGDARPWATYMFARSGILAVAACAFLAAGATFPVALAGALECAVIVGVMVVFRRAPLRGLRVAARARGGPWRAVLSVGGPAFTTQASLAAGTLILSGAGRPAAAGTFAACVRLLSGINAINGIVATSLYPRLARGAAGGSDGDRQVVGVALGLIALLATGATAVTALLGEPIAEVFLGTSSEREVAALVLTMAAALALGNIVLFTYTMLARGFERATIAPFALGGPLTLVLGIAAVASGGARVDLVAASLLAGQLVTMAGLGLRVRASCPDIALAVARAMALALLVAALASLSQLRIAALAAGLALLALSAVLAAALRPFARSLLAARAAG
jgi:O-antigen/teichoic acid export membrane protein